MKRSVSKKVSQFFKTKHESELVDFRLKTAAKNVVKHKNKKRIIFDNNHYIDVDFVVAGIGIKPSVDLAKNAGLECKDGIIVNNICLTSDNDIYAIGDCSNHYNEFYKKHLRLESVDNAIEQATLVAQNIVGVKSKRIHIPWSWSNQFNLKLQIAGFRNNADKKIIRGSMDQEKFSVLHIKNKRIICVESINSQKDFMGARKLIASKKDISLSAIADQANDLKTFL